MTFAISILPSDSIHIRQILTYLLKTSALKTLLVKVRRIKSGENQSEWLAL
jgi:hypothetical protein